MPKAADRKALPRYRRAGDEAPALVLTRRDLAIVEDVWRYGLLTTSQIEILRAADRHADLRFVSRLTLTRRLKLLFHHRYLRRIPRPLAQGSNEPIYVLDHTGARALSARHGDVTARPPSRLPKAAGLDHLLEIVQFRVALSAVSARPDAPSLVDWLPGEKVRFRVELKLPAERRQSVPIIPDAGFTVLAGGVGHHCFLEVDRGTEKQSVLAGKCRAYAEYFKGGGFSRDFNVPPQLGFRVLFTSSSDSGTQRILRAAEPTGAFKVLFAVARREEILPGRIGEKVWTSPGGGVSRFYEPPPS